MMWHEFCITVNNGFDTIVLDGLSIVLVKGVTNGELNKNAFDAIFRKLEWIRDNLEGVCVAKINHNQYTEVVEVMMSDDDVFIMGKPVETGVYFRKPGKYIHCMVPGYIFNRFVTPGQTMIGVKDGRYVYAENNAYIIATRRYTT